MAKRRSAQPPVSENGQICPGFWQPQPGDAALVVALARGASVPEAAAEAGVSDRTVRRRLEDDGFRRCVSEAQAELVNQSLAKIADGAARAVDVLIEQLDAEDPKTKLAAAKMVLEYALPMREVWQAAAEALRPTEERWHGDYSEIVPAGPASLLPALFDTDEADA